MTKNMATAYLAIGSNLGNRHDYIGRALRMLEEDGVKILKCSSIIETDPVGGPAQGKFLNAVLEVTTHLSPEDLLHVCQSIENKLDRVRTVKNGPRTIDLDILLYDELVVQSPLLTIPHPRMWLRDFVTQPLLEIAPHIIKKYSYENHQIN